MPKDYEPLIVYLKHSDKPFLELRDVAAFTGTQHGNLRTLIDSYIEREILTLKNANPMVYWGKGNREVDSYHLDAYALGILAETAISFSSKTRRDQIDHLIEYLHLEEYAGDEHDVVQDPEIAMEVSSGVTDAGPDPAARRPLPIQEKIVVAKAEEPPTDPVVTLIDGVPMADSRDVRKSFQMDHAEVINHIETILDRTKSSDDLGRDLVFKRLFDFDPDANRETFHYLMNRDAFTVLVMRFKTDRALKFQIGYVRKFREMEESLRSPSAGINWSLDTFIDQPLRMATEMATVIQGLLGRRAEDMETIDELTKQRDQQAGQLAYIDERAKAHKHGTLITDVATTLFVTRPTLVKWMLGELEEIPNKHPWLKRDHDRDGELCVASYGKRMGYVFGKNTRYYNKKRKQYELTQTPLITPLGQAYLARILKPNHPGYLKMKARMEKEAQQGKLNV